MTTHNLKQLDKTGTQTHAKVTGSIPGFRVLGLRVSGFRVSGFMVSGSRLAGFRVSAFTESEGSRPQSFRI